MSFLGPRSERKIWARDRSDVCWYVSSTSLVHVPIILSNYKNQIPLYCIIHLYCSLQRSNPCLMLWEVKLCMQCNLSDYKTKVSVVAIIF